MVVADLRAADADRERVVARLRRAHDEGRIDLFELDERTAAAYAARTYLDLEPLTSDLPAERPGGAGGAAGATRPGLSGRRPRGHALALRIEGAAWVFASAVNLLIWGIVCLTTLSLVYPWWMWVAGPWGVVLLGRAYIERVRARAHTRF